MAKQTLPTNFQDDVLNEVNPKRKYKMIMNDDATVSFEDVTEYDQVGSNFGAAQVNETNTAVNESADKSDIIDSTADVLANTASGKMASALAVKGLTAYAPMLPVYGYSGDMNNMPTGTFLCELAKCTNAPPYPMGMWAHVICYAGFSQTAIFYNGTNYPPVIATRTYANNAWTAWAEQAQGFDLASVSFNGRQDNALYVDLNNPYSDINKPRYVDRASSATGLPADCQWGIREVCRIMGSWVLVRITGYTTNSKQAIWTNFYTAKGGWNGWTKFEASKNNLGTYVDLINVSSYTFPSDGYLFLRASYRKGYYVIATLASATENGISFELGVTSLNNDVSGTGMQSNQTNTTFVRKGMRITKVEKNSASYNILRFYPLQ